MPKRGENIYKRKDGRWEGRYIKGRTVSGKAQYGYVYAKSYREVKEKLKDAGRENSAPAIPAESVTVGHIAAEWLDSLRPTVKESTWNKYYNMLHSHVLPQLGALPLCRLSCELLRQYCNCLLESGGRKGQGLSEKSVADVLSLVRSVLRYASQQGRAASFDFRAIQVRQHQKEIRVLSTSEQGKLCRYLFSDLNEYNIGILVCLFTGIRVGELCALRWEDISFSERTMHVHHTMQRIQTHSGAQKTRVVVTTPKSACSIRTIPIPDTLFAVIGEKYSTGKGYFLTNSENRIIEPRNMQNHFKSALSSSGIPAVNYHVLRHTFATRCVELGFDVKSLSEILGHANVNITMNRYVHPSMELKKQNMQLLSELIAVK